ncbi:MAG: hypothetical protein Q8Q18_01505 [bacterium]|nr:hypothetical protein [bacterium]
MLSAEQCKKIIGETNLSDREIEEIRNALYALVEGVFDDLAQKSTVETLDYKDRNSDDVTNRTIQRI